MTQSRKPVDKLYGNNSERILGTDIDKEIVEHTYEEMKTLLDVPTLPDAKGYLAFYSNDTITISEDDDNPSFFTGLIPYATPVGFTLIDAATGSVKNTSGRNMAVVSGTISLHPAQTGGGTATLSVISEVSTDDGATWTVNPFSLRQIPVSETNEPFATKVSSVSDWAADAWIRFRIVSSGQGTSTLEPKSETILGETVSGPSIVWYLQEG